MRGDGRQCLPRRLGPQGLVRIAVVGIEQHGFGTGSAQLLDVLENLLEGALAGPAIRAGLDRLSVSRRKIRGANSGTGRSSSAEMSFSRSTASLNQGIVNRSGCHGEPRRTARRFAASLLPPTQIGICPQR